MYAIRSYYDNGLVSFLSGSSGPQENLSSAYMYPNPVRPNFNIVDEKVKIKDVITSYSIHYTKLYDWETITILLN